MQCLIAFRLLIIATSMKIKLCFVTLRLSGTVIFEHTPIFHTFFPTNPMSPGCPLSPFSPGIPSHPKYTYTKLFWYTTQQPVTWIHIATTYFDHQSVGILCHMSAQCLQCLTIFPSFQLGRHFLSLPYLLLCHLKPAQQLSEAYIITVTPETNLTGCPFGPLGPGMPVLPTSPASPESPWFGRERK